MCSSMNLVLWYIIFGYYAKGDKLFIDIDRVRKCGWCRRVYICRVGVRCSTPDALFFVCVVWVLLYPSRSRSLFWRYVFIGM